MPRHEGPSFRQQFTGEGQGGRVGRAQAAGTWIHRPDAGDGSSAKNAHFPLLPRAVARMHPAVGLLLMLGWFHINRYHLSRRLLKSEDPTHSRHQSISPSLSPCERRQTPWHWLGAEEHSVKHPLS